jgi:hypothetical protein
MPGTKTERASSSGFTVLLPTDLKAAAFLIESLEAVEQATPAR